MAEIRNRDDFLAWLNSLPLEEQAIMARTLARVETTRAIREIGDTAVYKLTRDRSRAEVAKRLGTGEAAINKAIARHRGQPRPRKREAE